ncbi:hypothetical protein F2Q69_00036461 [Brassica cretica]|uniref:Uncharacterized protein n=1 Tax=Brassica cretica TaxID=69181 RepID=A0A8S9SQN3_BRACR|nr:hypothetical protein F2Q69_00036461 [Brassica cretica]
MAIHRAVQIRRRHHSVEGNTTATPSSLTHLRGTFSCFGSLRTMTGELRRFSSRSRALDGFISSLRRYKGTGRASLP